MKKILLIIFNKLIQLKNLLTQIKNYLISIFLPGPNINSTQETLELLTNEKYSISRFGDGEFGLMSGEDLIFQPYSKELKERLIEIIECNNPNHLVGIPDIFNNLDTFTIKARKYWEGYLALNRGKIYRFLNPRKKYYDSLVTRLYIDKLDKQQAGKNFSTFMKLWENREIVIVEGSKSRLGLGNNLFHKANCIERIICPSQDAFASYDRILNFVKDLPTTKLILIALGPTATVLAYDLSLLGYQAVDIGHIDIEYEWYLQNAEEKKPIKGKYIGEVVGGTSVINLHDEKFESEVLIRII